MADGFEEKTICRLLLLLLYNNNNNNNNNNFDFIPFIFVIILLNKEWGKKHLQNLYWRKELDQKWKGYNNNNNNNNNNNEITVDTIFIK